MQTFDGPKQPLSLTLSSDLVTTVLALTPNLSELIERLLAEFVHTQDVASVAAKESLAIQNTGLNTMGLPSTNTSDNFVRSGDTSEPHKT
jgi:hypothetical protein